MTKRLFFHSFPANPLRACAITLRHTAKVQILELRNPGENKMPVPIHLFHRIAVHCQILEVNQCAQLLHFAQPLNTVAVEVEHLIGKKKSAVI